MISKQISQLPDAAFARDLRVPVQPSEGGETASMTMATLQEAVGGIILPRLEIRVKKKGDTSTENKNDLIQVSFVGPTGYWQSLNPQIWLYRYRPVRKFGTKRWAHPVDRYAHLNHPGSKYYGGKSFLVTGPDGDRTSTIINRVTEFAMPELPNTWIGIPFEPYKYFNKDGAITTGGIFPVEYPTGEDPAPERILPTSRRGSKRSTQRYRQFFALRVVCDDPNRTDGRRLLGPLSNTFAVKPQIHRDGGGEAVKMYTRLVMDI